MQHYGILHIISLPSQLFWGRNKLLIVEWRISTLFLLKTTRTMLSNISRLQLLLFKSCWWLKKRHFVLFLFFFFFCLKKPLETLPTKCVKSEYWISIFGTKKMLWIELRVAHSFKKEIRTNFKILSFVKKKKAFSCQSF